MIDLKFRFLKCLYGIIIGEVWFWISTWQRFPIGNILFFCKEHIEYWYNIELVKIKIKKRINKLIEFLKWYLSRH